MKKLFLAIATQEGLEPSGPQIIKKLRMNADQRDLDIRWVPLENYHVTLVFLGNTPEDKLPEIEAIMHESASATSPFQLKISDIGAFPDEFSSRVLWFGVQNSRTLRALQDNLSQKFRDHHYRLEDRAYSPHLTIARLRNPHKTKDMMSPFRRKKIGKVSVSEIVLYESVGSAPFPVYKPLLRVPLTGEPVNLDEDSSENSFSEAE
ncbi:MAG: RNA 2',3'-cyclic phosphodiesterase [Bdellovibrionales bacterium]|nr:RNA 2',3'-cyclic phosphodiesterase [Bdellovibrionales bacterium]